MLTRTDKNLGIRTRRDLESCLESIGLSGRISVRLDLIPMGFGFFKNGSEDIPEGRRIVTEPPGGLLAVAPNHGRAMFLSSYSGSLLVGRVESSRPTNCAELVGLED